MLRSILMAGVSVGFVLAATADPLLDRVLADAAADPEKGELYTFDMSYTDGDLTLDMKIDQSQPVGERVVEMSPAPDTLEGDQAKFAKMLQRETRGMIWCSSFAENMPANATRVSETETTATYNFTPVAGEDDGQMAKAYKFLEGEAVIDKVSAGILSYQMVAPKPFKPMMVAKISEFNMRVDCKTGPDGRTRMETMKMALAGKAMMQTLDQTESRVVSNLLPVAVTKAKAEPTSGTGSK